MVERLLSLLFLPLNEIPQEPNSFRSNLLEPLCPGSSRSHSLRRRPYSVLGSIQGWFIMEAWTLEPGVQCHSASLKTLLSCLEEIFEFTVVSSTFFDHQTLRPWGWKISRFFIHWRSGLLLLCCIPLGSGVKCHRRQKYVHLCMCVCVSLSLSIYVSGSCKSMCMHPSICIKY